MPVLNRPAQVAVSIDRIFAACTPDGTTLSMTREEALRLNINKKQLALHDHELRQVLKHLKDPMVRQELLNVRKTKANTQLSRFRAALLLGRAAGFVKFSDEGWIEAHGRTIPSEIEINV